MIDDGSCIVCGGKGSMTNPCSAQCYVRLWLSDQHANEKMIRDRINDCKFLRDHLETFTPEQRKDSYYHGSLLNLINDIQGLLTIESNRLYFLKQGITK